MHLFGTLSHRLLTNNTRLICVVSLASERYYHYAGQRVARLERHQSVFDAHRSPTLWIRVISFIFFNAPMAHLRTLEDNCVDGLAQEIPWIRFVTEIKEEWLMVAIAVSVHFDPARKP